MDRTKIVIQATWDSEAKVWVAESDDVPGLITEAENLDILLEKLSAMVPELLEANGVIPRAKSVPFDLVAHNEVVASH